MNGDRPRHHATGLSRRGFVRRAAATLAAAPLGALFGDARWTLRAPARERVLVVLELAGGNDGLATVVPHGLELYRRARTSTLAPAAKLLRLDDDHALHPHLKGTKREWDAGRLAIVQGVAYPKPDRSHFKSLEIWHTAEPAGNVQPWGWLGRYADLHLAGEDDPNVLVNVGNAPSRALLGRTKRPVTFSNPDSYRFVAKAAQREPHARLNAPRAADDSNLEFLRRVGATAGASSAAVRRAAGGYRPRVAYPDTRLGTDLLWAAGIVAAGLATRVIYLVLGGFDTHAAQKGKHDGLMTELDGALSAFQRDLLANGHADRVVTLVFSEFGRRVAENASGGTDHGVAGPMLLLGAPVHGGFYGRLPSLADLDHGDLRMEVDFRAVYATVLARWLGADAGAVLGAEFAPVGDVFG